MPQLHRRNRLSDANAIWITEAWDSKASHDASLSLPQVRAAIAKARPLIAGFGDGVVTTPIGGFGLAPAQGTLTRALYTVRHLRTLRSPTHAERPNQHNLDCAASVRNRADRGLDRAPPANPLGPPLRGCPPSKWIQRGRSRCRTMDPQLPSPAYSSTEDHVWVTHLPETLTEEEPPSSRSRRSDVLRRRAPGLELDAQGKLVQGRAQAQRPFGWPRNPHGIFVDHNDFVWIGTYMHHRVQKFTRDGKLVPTIGHYDTNAGSNDTTLLGGPVRHLGRSEDERGLHLRWLSQPPFIVFDGATGKYLRHWGAYGRSPTKPSGSTRNDGQRGAAEQFSTPHGLTGSKDGKIYVADRRGNHIQVFDQQGKFLRRK